MLNIPHSLCVECFVLSKGNMAKVASPLSLFLKALYDIIARKVAQSQEVLKISVDGWKRKPRMNTPHLWSEELAGATFGQYLPMELCW